MTTIAIGGIMHEVPIHLVRRPTDFAAFSQTFARNLVNLWGESHHEMGGFIQGATAYNYTAYPTLMASATPAGRVTDDAFDRFTEMFNPTSQICPPNMKDSSSHFTAQWSWRVIRMVMAKSCADSVMRLVEISRLLSRSTSTLTSPSRWSRNRRHS